MGENMLHNYGPLKLENTAINKFKTFVVEHGQNTVHQTGGVKIALIMIIIIITEVAVVLLCCSPSVFERIG